MNLGFEFFYEWGNGIYAVYLPETTQKEIKIACGETHCELPTPANLVTLRW